MTTRDELARVIANHQDYRMGALVEMDVTIADYELADVLMPTLAGVWDEGAKWAAVETNAIRDERDNFLAPGDNPYRQARSNAVPEGETNGRL